MIAQIILDIWQKTMINYSQPKLGRKISNDAAHNFIGHLKNSCEYSLMYSFSGTTQLKIRMKLFAT